MNVSNVQIWSIIILLGIGTYLIRFSFLGLIGDRPIPDLIRRGLRYVGVAILPAITAPLVVWPEATQGAFDLPRISAAVMTLLVGFIWKNTLGAILAGFVTLYSLLYLLG